MFARGELGISPGPLFRGLYIHFYCKVHKYLTMLILNDAYFWVKKLKTLMIVRIEEKTILS